MKREKQDSKENDNRLNKNSLPDSEELIYDWNTIDGDPYSKTSDIEFDDETLRDGLQSPSVKDPSIDEKIEILHLMEEIGIHTADVGLPGAGPRARSDVTALVKEIVSSSMKLTPNCAARTVIADIQPIADISQEIGIPIECCAFIGSSPIRLYAEEWTLDIMVKRTTEAVTFAHNEGLPVMFVTEDTVRANPVTLATLFDAAIDSGASRLCLCGDRLEAAFPEPGCGLRFQRVMSRCTSRAFVRCLQPMAPTAQCQDRGSRRGLPRRRDRLE